MKITRFLSLLFVSFVAIAVAGCEKKLESAQYAKAQAARDGAAEFANIVERPKDSTLAYEHNVSIEIDRSEIAERVEAVRAACLADKQSGCTILEASVNTSDGYATGSVKMRLAPTGVDALIKVAGENAKETSRQTHAEDLAQPLADVARQLQMLNGYRDKLTALTARKDMSATDLIAVSKELASTQTQIEQLSGENAQLRKRIDTDLLTLHWTVPDSQARAADSPVMDALSAFAGNFREALGQLIEFLAYAIPWIVLGLPALILLRMFWRWSGAWLARRTRQA